MTSRRRGTRQEKLPTLLERKLYKTGQTRGASTREIYQNRVLRNSTVLIPLDFWEQCRVPEDGTGEYENGYIVLVEPSWYFTTPDADAQLAEKGLELGVDAMLLFQRRSDWATYAPKSGRLPNGKPFVPPPTRLSPIRGTYMARVHSTTAGEGGEAVVTGFNTTALRGAGIRVYEYASSQTIVDARLQLECLVWLCHDAVEALTAAGMTLQGAKDRRAAMLLEAGTRGLLDYDRLRAARMLDADDNTICPLCLERISAAAFMERGEQAEGRETWDITITELSLFHIEELRVGRLQHKPYNLGWGHHHCNVVVKDAGIIPTLKWMKSVLDNNGDSWQAIAEAEELVEEAVHSDL